MSDQAMLLVADDDPAVRQSLERTLTREGYGVVLAPDGQAALDRLRQGGIDLLLSDLKMPGLTGLELLKQAREAAPDVDVILLTAFGTVEEAVRAMKDGAIDFLTKPLQRAQLVRVIRQALERRSLIQQNRALKERLDDLLREGNAIGVSYAFKQMMTLVGQVADSSATVLMSLRVPAVRQAGQGEYYALLLISTVGAIYMAAARELLTAYISLELLSFCLYILVSFAKSDPRSNEAGRGPSWPSTARPCPRPCSSPSSSATRRAPSRGRGTARRGVSSWPTAERSSSTRSPISRPSPSRRSSACCRRASSSAWGARARCAWTCASSPPPTRT